jgi:hypothetical protein
MYNTYIIYSYIIIWDFSLFWRYLYANVDGSWYPGIPWDPSAPFWYNVGATKFWVEIPFFLGYLEYIAS